MRIITGATGTTHVTSNDDGEFNQGIFGAGLIVFANGGQLEASIVDNNTIRIKDGDLLIQGRHALIEPNTTEDVSIDTGAVGMNRNDLIVARYALDTNTGYESIVLEVIKGAESAGEATDPSYTTGDIRTGSVLVEVPLYRVRINGITVSGIDKLFSASKDLFGKIVDLGTEIESLKKSVSDGKFLVAGAITAKGINTAADASFETMAENISLIGPGNDSSGDVNNKYSGHMEEAFYEADSLGANWTGTLTNNAVNLAADGAYIVILAYSHSVNANYAGVNFGCDWKNVQFPSGAEATLLYENGLDGISLFRAYKVTTGATAGAITATVQLWGHYDKKAALEVCVLN